MDTLVFIFVLVWMVLAMQRAPTHPLTHASPPQRRTTPAEAERSERHRVIAEIMLRETREGESRVDHLRRFVQACRASDEQAKGEK